MMLRIISVLFAVGLTGAAEAQVAVWSTAASACVPSEVTTKLNRHKLGVASVQHVASNVDQIVLTCPSMAEFSTTGLDSLRLRITYLDSTGPSVSAFVRARLFGMVMDTNDPVLLAVVNSNTSSMTTLNSLDSGLITHNFNFTQNTYWVRLDMDRSSTSETVILHSVFLIGNPDGSWPETDVM